MSIVFSDMATSQHCLPIRLVGNGHGITSRSVLKFRLENEKHKVLGCCNVRESYCHALERGYLVGGTRSTLRHVRTQLCARKSWKIACPPSSNPMSHSAPLTTKVAERKVRLSVVCSIPEGCLIKLVFVEDLIKVFV